MNVKKQILGILTIGLCFFTTLLAQNNAELKSFEQEITTNLQNGNKSGAAAAMNKAGYLLWNSQSYNEAIKYYKQALEIAKEMSNIKGQQVLYNNIGMIYSDMEDFQNAIPYLENSLKIAQNLRMRKEEAYGLTNLAMALQGAKKHKEAIANLENAVRISTELNDLILLRRCYGMIYENYEEIGDTEKAFKYFDLYESFDRKIKKVEMEVVRTEAHTQVSSAIADKEATERVLRKTEESLQVVEKLTREQQLEIDLKEAKIRENEATFLAQEAKIRASRQMSLFIGIVLFISLSFVLVLLRQTGQ
ncbi:MAG: tetratricopeptide repeat protein [Bacteroidales bacterium]|nr:tetratricopeptide repeat protein [Bacteroidales bacterium]